MKLYDKDKQQRLAQQERRKELMNAQECVCGAAFRTFPEYADHVLSCKAWNDAG